MRLTMFKKRIITSLFALALFAGSLTTVQETKACSATHVGLAALLAIGTPILGYGGFSIATELKNKNALGAGIGSTIAICAIGAYGWILYLAAPGFFAYMATT